MLNFDARIHFEIFSPYFQLIDSRMFLDISQLYKLFCDVPVGFYALKGNPPPFLELVKKEEAKFINIWLSLNSFN